MFRKKVCGGTFRTLVKADLGLARSACSSLTQTVDSFAVTIAVFAFRSAVCAVKKKKKGEILIKGTPPPVIAGGWDFQLMCAFARVRRRRRRRLILNDIG